MIKIIRVLLGTALGLFLAHYLGFVGVQGLQYLWATLVIAAVVFIVKGFNW